MGAGQIVNPLVWIEAEAKFLDQLPRRAAHAACLEHAAGRHFPAEEQIVLNRQARDQRELLKHGTYANGASPMRRQLVDFFSSIAKFAFVRSECARDDVDQ